MAWKRSCVVQLVVVKCGSCSLEHLGLSARTLPDPMPYAFQTRIPPSSQAILLRLLTSSIFPWNGLGTVTSSHKVTWTPGIPPLHDIVPPPSLRTLTCDICFFNVSLCTLNFRRFKRNSNNG